MPSTVKYGSTVLTTTVRLYLLVLSSMPTMLTPFHPYSTLLFVAAALYVVAGSIVSNAGNAARGAALIALGLPVYAFWRSRGAGVRA